MYCFCGGVASFNVFCVLVTYPPGLGRYGRVCIYIWYFWASCRGLCIEPGVHDRGVALACGWETRVEIVHTVGKCLACMMRTYCGHTVVLPSE
eukprot:COSAG01_NODE_3629_length_5848_cov_127.580797_7_plen_93_part_00